MAQNDYHRFSKLTFDQFRELAKQNNLSGYEKIGFPECYRKDKEAFIYQDLITKLTALTQGGSVILDVGSGCSELPHMLIKNAKAHNQQLITVDSEEMLAHLPDEPQLEKIAAYYPRCDALFEKYTKRVDAIIIYSVLHYIFVEGNIWEFLDKSLSLLAPGGQMLIGDIPNISKRKRFFASEAGVKFHQEFTGTNEVPRVEFNCIEENQLDDSVILSLVMRARSQGFDAYILPQPCSLPMANRREDILIVRP